MAFKILDSCINCWACESVCPSQAITIHEAFSRFMIDADKCMECEGFFADPQCASICPIEGAIVDDSGSAVNPPGSLTSIAPEHLEATMAEIRAR